MDDSLKGAASPQPAAKAGGDAASGVVPPEMEGRRLDQALELVLPGAGLRARKRAWEAGAVLVDGRPRPKGYRVMAGQVLALRAEGARQGAGCADGEQPGPGCVPEGVRVVGQSTGIMAALFKPGGVHSEAIAGRPGPSVDQCLGAFWPGRFARLVNRLDLPTSGLLAVALSEVMAARYRELEDQAAVTKTYAALVRGRVADAFVCTGAIDAARRRAVRVLDAADPTGLRHTRVEPVLAVERDELPGPGATLVRCRIHKGARHQIRAHLAAAGHPVLGDGLYGPQEGARLYLHHFRLSLPDFEAAAPPLWPEWADWGLGKADF
ncbi:RNA pseudouridine synthase [Desulfocurvus sp.]|uniref:pseudouridine synthase family protein n=1 Tax=Desulfocurvus sp. TaxID=2871698 RepID=UPI0025C0D741|nr:RNA pseudouridine synthase [Desulfocurvus sp.]MCK9240855.1 RNA pseudouridine synthase [Desulfocurvus sp.]